MHRAVAAVVAVALLTVIQLGCSSAAKPDPAGDRLNTGQICIVAPSETKTAGILAPDNMPFSPGSVADQLPRVTIGDKVEIITDESLPSNDQRRQVKVKILTDVGPVTDGKLVGTVCTITRYDIRPIDQQPSPK